MRLICPNCGAQYAVADDAIPTGGRDVQCSNCQHTWFETPGASANDAPPEPRTPTPPPRPAPSAGQFSGSISDAFKDVAEDENLAPAPQPPKNRKPVDPSVADILREEAALETAQRKTETPVAMESQVDFGLSDPAPAPVKAPEPTPDVKPKADTTVTAASTAANVAAAAQASRRELLPDIEEINSSLRSDAERVEDGTAAPMVATDANRKSFRRGFTTVLLIILLMVVVYMQADRIGNAVPALAGPLQSYVDAVDVGRIWLDDNVQAMLTAIAPE
jgi:predicted Zn finger-like uncharacterized protein